jgi:hypothetical protein
VFLQDLLAAACASSDGQPFAVINADIILDPDFDLVARVGNLQPRELLFSRRIDVETPEQRSGTPYLPGFDFFAARPDPIRGLADAGLVFGSPWWDHYLPIGLHLMGCRLTQVKRSFAFHLKHPAQHLATLDLFGQRFLETIKGLAMTPRYSAMVDNAITGYSGNLISDLRYSIWKRLPKNTRGESRRVLNRLARANVDYIDSVSDL